MKGFFDRRSVVHVVWIIFSHFLYLSIKRLLLIHLLVSYRSRSSLLSLYVYSWRYFGWWVGAVTGFFRPTVTVYDHSCGSRVLGVWNTRPLLLSKHLKRHWAMVRIRNWVLFDFLGKCLSEHVLASVIGIRLFEVWPFSGPKIGVLSSVRWGPCHSVTLRLSLLFLVLWLFRRRVYLVSP